MSIVPFILVQLAVFGGLVFLLRRLLSRNLMTASARLQQLSTEYVQRQEELKKRLEESERQYQEQVGRAKVESEKLAAETRQEADGSRARVLEQARLEGERIVQQARDAGEGLKRDLQKEIEQRAVERACEIIHEVLPGELRQIVQAHWLDQLIGNGLTQLEQLRTEEQVSEAKICSAFAISDGQRTQLKRWLKERLGREIPIAESTDEHLVAGLVITLGSLVLDGSLASKVRRAARQMQESA